MPALAPDSAQRGFLSFFRHWELPKLMAFSWSIWFFWAGVLANVDAPSPEWIGPALGLLGFLGVWVWLRNDQRRFPEVASHYRSLAWFAAWPVLLPFYVAETRGWRRVAAGVVCALFFAAGGLLVGAVLGGLALTYSHP